MQASPRGFYVYELIDPRTSETFYIGKGKGRRAWSHAISERRGKGCNALKRERLGQIRRAGLDVVVGIIRDGMEEGDAIRLERSLIVRGHEALTNISHGSHTAMEIVVSDCREGLAQLKPLCVLVREGASKERLRIWANTIAGLHRIRATAAASV